MRKPSWNVIISCGPVSSSKDGVIDEIYRNSTPHISPKSHEISSLHYCFVRSPDRANHLAVIALEPNLIPKTAEANAISSHRVRSHLQSGPLLATSKIASKGTATAHSHSSPPASSSQDICRSFATHAGQSRPTFDFLSWHSRTTPGSPSSTKCPLFSGINSLYFLLGTSFYHRHSTLGITQSATSTTVPVLLHLFVAAIKCKSFP